MDKLCFYIRADRIMNGFPEKPSWKELFFRFLPDSIVPSPYLIIDYLRNVIETAPTPTSYFFTNVPSEEYSLT